GHAGVALRAEGAAAARGKECTAWGSAVGVRGAAARCCRCSRNPQPFRARRPGGGRCHFVFASACARRLLRRRSRGHADPAPRSGRGDQRAAYSRGDAGSLNLLYALRMNRPLERSVPPDTLARFAAIVGDKYALTDPRAIEPYLIEQRGLYHGRTPLVLLPGTVEEVAAILKLAAETGTPIVPQGGNTGLVGGQVPLQGEILLSLTRLDRIREVDASSNTITCEAGVVLAKAQEAAEHAGRLFPLSLGAE